jgi:tetratricopeptide (TPR) repeat protein
MLGEIYEGMGFKEEAMRYYETSLEINPNRYEYVFAAAALAQTQGNNEQAL